MSEAQAWTIAALLFLPETPMFLSFHIVDLMAPEASPGHHRSLFAKVAHCILLKLWSALFHRNPIFGDTAVSIGLFFIHFFSCIIQNSKRSFGLVSEQLDLSPASICHMHHGQSDQMPKPKSAKSPQIPVPQTKIPTWVKKKNCKRPKKSRTC